MMVRTCIAWRLVVIAAGCLASLTAVPLWAESTPRELATNAIQEYRAALDEEDRTRRTDGFRRAYLLFEKASASIDSPTADLLANLGNAAAQSQQPGKAVVAYRRALLIDPQHRRAQTNLNVVRQQLPEWARYQPPASLIDSLFFWNRVFGRETVQSIAAVAFLIAALLVAASIRGQQPILRNLAVLPLVAWLVLLGSTLSVVGYVALDMVWRASLADYLARRRARKSQR